MIPRHLQLATMAMTPGGTLPEDASVDSRGNSVFSTVPKVR